MPLNLVQDVLQILMLVLTIIKLLLEIKDVFRGG